jgi:hypothetical protein
MSNLYRIHCIIGNYIVVSSMRNLSRVLERNIGRSDLIVLCSDLLKKGVSKDLLYSEFNNYLETHTCSDDLEEELVDVLDILSGYHNPYVVINGAGISMKPVHL